MIKSQKELSKCNHFTIISNYSIWIVFEFCELSNIFVASKIKMRMSFSTFVQKFHFQRYFNCVCKSKKLNDETSFTSLGTMEKYIQNLYWMIERLNRIQNAMLFFGDAITKFNNHMKPLDVIAWIDYLQIQKNLVKLGHKIMIFMSTFQNYFIIRWNKTFLWQNMSFLGIWKISYPKSWIITKETKVRENRDKTEKASKQYWFFSENAPFKLSNDHRFEHEIVKWNREWKWKY